MYIPYNANPDNLRVGDCTVRAISLALEKSWEMVYTGLYLKGYSMSDMPSANAVWGAYLRDHGFVRRVIPDDSPHDYTVRDFCEDHPNGTYLLAIDGHLACVKNGNLFDAWNSSGEYPVYYWVRKDEK